MNIFNRIVVTLLLLALIPIVTVSLIVPDEAVQLLQDTLDDAEVEDSPSVVELLLRGGLALLIDAVLVFLLYLEVRRRRGPRVVPVRLAGGGEAKVAVDSIVGRLEYRVDRLPGVLGAKAQISGRRKGVEPLLEVETVADVYLPSMIEEITAITRQVVEDEMGLKLKGKPKINLHPVSYPSTPAAEEAPFADEADEPVLSEFEDPVLDEVEEPVLEGEVVVDEDNGGGS
jgi:hypothetical protein